MFALLEVMERGVKQGDVVKEEHDPLVEEHCRSFIAGTGLYTHGACASLMKQHSFTMDDIHKKTDALNKAKTVLSSVKELSADFYKCTDNLEIIDNTFKFRTGVGAGLLWEEFRKRLWEKSGKTASFDVKNTSLSDSHGSLLAFLVSSPASKYFYQIDSHPYFKDLIQPQSASTNDDSGRGAGRNEQRTTEKEHKRAKPARSSSSSSAQSPQDAIGARILDTQERLVRNAEKNTKVTMLTTLISAVPAHMRQPYIDQLTALLSDDPIASSGTLSPRPDSITSGAPTPRPDSAISYDEQL